MTYAEKLKHPKWQKKRLAILSRDNFTCCLCGDTETNLQVHHLKYTGEPWDAPDEDLQTLCEDCHSLLSQQSGIGAIKIYKENFGVFIQFIVVMIDDGRKYTTAYKMKNNEVFTSMDLDSDVIHSLSDYLKNT